MPEKKLKDPIYGYIKIEKDIVNDIIDTSCFQRLRHIRQTSYAPLYSAALHNRFVHSIGVFHLGEIAFNALKDAVYDRYKNDVIENEWARLKKYFLLACLLHDVGHAPFSHSGEQFFLNDGGTHEATIYSDLKKAVNCNSFTIDMNLYHQENKQAAPHEIMSVTIAISVFDSYFSEEKNRDFFARCITGYTHRKSENIQCSVENVIISLLNSSIIDVDKLDYLIRDAYVIGFDSISIDFDRLLNSVTIEKIDDKEQLVFNKSALSVLENVIYAHDSERKWIQNHPVVLYEHFLIQYAITALNKSITQNTAQHLFCFDALLEKGMDFDGSKISLLCDDDVIHLIKNRFPDELILEYFGRNTRRRPVWKSEAEYKALFSENLGEKPLDRLERQLERVEKFLLEENEMPIINENAISQCKKKLDQIDETSLPADDKKAQKQKYMSILTFMDCLESFSKESSIPFDYVLIRTRHFRSGFSKDELSSTIVYFPSINKKRKLGEVVTLLKSGAGRDKFFYLYYKRGKTGNIDIQKLTDKICCEAIAPIG